MSALTIIRIYVLSVLGWALVGALGAYCLLLAAFTWVAYSEGMTYSLLPVPGFFALCMGVGALIGGGAGVEPAQMEVYRREAALKRARQLHPSTR